MPAEVTLLCKAGKLSGKRYRFRERGTCLVGRHPECRLRLPNDDEHNVVSRHHCLLDINPPDIRIRDFGSLNGTYVNGSKIGQREKGTDPGLGAHERYPEFDLRDGDNLQIGATTFEIRITIPTYCALCSKDISKLVKERKRSDSDSEINYCDACISLVNTARGEVPFARKEEQCAACGLEITGDSTHGRTGDSLCDSCRTDPSRILTEAQRGEKPGGKSFRGIENYSILRKLGQGGMGAVYLAKDESTGREIALKIMLPEVATHESARALFLRETENTKALKHPNVVQVLDSGYSNGTFFICLEYCEGGSVDDWLKEAGGKLALDDAVDATFQVLDGLEYAHGAAIPYVKLEDGTIGQGHGLVHRDIKPKNLFLSNAGAQRTVKVGDYGLAKAFDMAGLSGQTWTGLTCGSPYFVPRQQVINFKYSKPEVDVWAVAASLYNMLTGRYPREFPKGQDPWHVILQTGPTPIGAYRGDLPKKVAGLIDSALIDNPKLRFSTAAEFRKALEEAL